MRWLALFALTVLVSACGSTRSTYVQIPSESYNDRVRYLVIHHTAIDYAESLEALTEPDRVSAHYLIPERGDPSYPKDKLEIQQLVQETDRAWHAGVSYWQGKNGLNDQSIGIELVHRAPCLLDETQPDHKLGLNSHALDHSICYYPEYDDKQIELLIKLSRDILARHPEITPTRVVAHGDIAPSRKVDPSPRFPWYRLYKAGIGAWYEQETLLKYFDLFSDKPLPINLFQQALNQYGYQVTETGVLDAQTTNVLTVFQMHFRPWEVTGKPDVRSASALFALLERYFPKKAEWLLDRHEREYQASQLPKTANTSGQLNLTLAKASRDAVSFKAQYQGAEGQGTMTLNSDRPVTFNLVINGKAVKKLISLNGENEITLDIGALSRQGQNYIKLENISDDNSIIMAHVPYPVLTDNTKQAEVDFSQVDTQINSDIKGGFPGAVLAVVKDGKLIKHQAYGYSQRYRSTGEQLTDPDKMTTDTLFDLASNTKMYATNYAVMKLVSEGLLNVNRPINYYLPEYQGAGREQRLVKDLLQHRAGYEPSTAFYSKEATEARGLFSQNPERTAQLLLTKLPFKTSRDLKSVYSDNDYLILGLLIERITGKALDEYAENEIFKPLGINRTVFNPLQKGFSRSKTAATELAGNSRGGRVGFENIRQDVVRGEVHDEKAFYSMGGVAGHAGLFSTASDVAELAMILLNRGGYGESQLFSAGTLDQFLKPSDADITTGLGWRRAGNGDRSWQFGPYASPYAIGHTGWTGTVTVIDPFHDLVIVLLTNKKHTPILNENGKLQFLGDKFETGKYGSIIALVYEAVLNLK